jgi:hypothetical protein
MWYYFIHKELEVKTSNPERLKYLYENSKNGIMRSYFTKGYVLSLIAPEHITRNERGLHNINEPAIKYDRGGIYMINGRNLPKKYFDKIASKKLSVEDFFNEDNQEVKSAMLGMMQEKYGDEHIIHFFKEHIKEVDTYVDKKDSKYLEGTTNGMNVGVYTLFKGKLNTEPVAYVRCYCPSTDRMFFLGVEPNNSSAKDAIASLYRVPKILEPYIKNISRQGERFSTTFTAEGKQILESITQKQIQDNTTISGDKYFKLINYEY